jgi:hypothetical protein
MTSRAPLGSSFVIFVAAALGAVAAIYYGAIPWALDAAVGASFWLFGYR